MCVNGPPTEQMLGNQSEIADGGVEATAAGVAFLILRILNGRSGECVKRRRRRRISKRREHRCSAM